MPAEVQAPQGLLTRVRVSTSAAVQLYAALYMVGFLHLQGTSKAPWVKQFVQANPELLDRLDEVYHPIHVPELECAQTCWEGADILVYALATGTLDDLDLDRFFQRLPAAAAQEYGHIDMPTEPRELEDHVSARLARNTADPAVRARYVGVLLDIWNALRPQWEAQGLARATADGLTVTGQLESATTLEDALPVFQIARRERFAPVVQAALERGEIVLTPLAFGGPGGAGQHVVQVPGLLSIGYSLDLGRKLDDVRERADRAAAKYKALADPTRASLLMLVSSKQYSITDLATVLGISQPTVSVHMKQLREAGLVTLAKSGQFTLYRSTPEGIQEFLAEAAADLLDRDITPDTSRQ